MMDQTERNEMWREMQRQAALAYAKENDGLGLQLPTVGSVRIYEGDGALLMFAGTTVESFTADTRRYPAMLDPARVAELRDYLDAWLAAQAGRRVQ